MKIYGLKACGHDTWTGSNISIISKTLFFYKHEAEIYKDQFLKLCIKDDHRINIDSNHPISIKIVEYDIEEKI